MKIKSRSSRIKILASALIGGAIFLGVSRISPVAYRWAFEERQTLRILFAEDKDGRAQLEALGQTFHRIYPNITLEWVAMPATRYLTADDQPEPIALQNFDLVWGSSGHAVSLAAQELLGCDIDTKLVGKTADALQQLASGMDKACALPLYFADYMMVYSNKAVLPEIPREAGLLLTKLKGFRDPANHKFGLALGDDAYSFLGFMGGAHYFEPEAETGSRPDETLAAAFDTYAQLSFFKELTPTDCPEKCLIKMFLEQRAPLLIGGEWLRAELEKALGQKLGMTSLETLSRAGIPIKTPYDGRYVMNLKASSAKKSTARQIFYEFLTDPETQSTFAENWLKVPSIKPRDEGEGAFAASEWILLTESFMAIDQQRRIRILAKLDPILRDFHHGRLIPKQAGMALQSKLAESE